jgi:hypothetical protein
VIYDDGKAVTDFFGNYLVNPYTGLRFESSPLVLQAEFAVGRKSGASAFFRGPSGERESMQFFSKVVGKETITVPAGTFEAFKIETEIYRQGGRMTGYGKAVTWIAPEHVRRPLATELVMRLNNNAPVRAQRLELISFQERK